MISDESDRFNPRDPKPADAGKPSKSVKRREARQLATQALYQWHMAKQSLNEIEAQFRVDNDFTDVDGAYFREILHGVPAKKVEIDEALKRLDNGTYGNCEMSGKPIPHARLEALPFTRYTVECQAELEKRNRFSRVRQPVTSLFGLSDEEGDGDDDDNSSDSKD